MLSQHLNKNNLHHAYLIEGNRDMVLPEVLKFIKSLGVDTIMNGDLINIAVDSLKIEDARNLKSYGNEKGQSSLKKIFIISANSITIEAQNTLLKMFEEPIEDTIFFLVVPDTNALLKTLVSRFYLIKLERESEFKDAEKFITMPLSARVNFIKELLVETEDEADETTVSQNSTRGRALDFLNTLELTLHKKYDPKKFPTSCFLHLFKVRQFLRQPGSSTKSLLESVALIVPKF